MRIAYLDIKNFRGISSARIYFDGHTVIIGDNNAGKSTIFEAIDLVLGPDRLNRIPVIDEHDFYNGEYYNPGGDNPIVKIELLITGLEEDQLDRFGYHIEFWDEMLGSVIAPGQISETDKDNVTPALRLRFTGSYNEEDDDFEGETHFCWPEKSEGVAFAKFGKSDKRECGFLYLRALRTGTRALSMERGSLLDIILKIRELRPKMWEDILSQLRQTNVATAPELGIKNILEEVQQALKEFVPSDWGTEPLLRVSDLTREHLRRTLTIFMSTGIGTYHAPFQHQGTGTINTMVLALLSMIAEAKKNVIFAMEEPEIAIPPYTQKRVVSSITGNSTQAIFTSHSPFVLEEFKPSQIVLIQRDKGGIVKSQSVQFPAHIKSKQYSSEFRTRFCEALLAKRILLTEGATEATAYTAAARRLNELAPTLFKSLEAMGVAVFNVMSQTAVAQFGAYFRNLGKTVFAVFDKQRSEALINIASAVHYPYESDFAGFEELMVQETAQKVLEKFVSEIVSTGQWPTHLSSYIPSKDATVEQWQEAVYQYLKWSKGAAGAAELISYCEAINDVPATLRNVLTAIKDILEPIADHF
ncbi:putative ATP-dependent endonuclease of OLD family [Chitinophaga terrae (ex Kim and Jung 2007)]|uniref:ATP-dependent nuclease n=1 Tax=Chitinophaga terrae (ex Kim and Jung 2007) TaxID=408074 RepID=UPI00278B201E|nr:AAA family ATPase [Chitinophaga terrae (ex Kim and Jung 2007)]MDQ0107523.1 putative ATP-dependent endonuclease of OLD family [Chitinophaga terrae (ex Kim and Jung 2007)]